MNNYFRPISELPEGYGNEILGWNKEWIDEDYSLDGTRLCFLSEEGYWTMTVWCGYHDEYHTRYTKEYHELMEGTEETFGKIQSPPTHWIDKPNIDLKDALDKLFLECEHGDAEHRQWLRDKFDDFYRRLTDSK